MLRFESTQFKLNNTEQIKILKQIVFCHGSVQTHKYQNSVQSFNEYFIANKIQNEKITSDIK